MENMISFVYSFSLPFCSLVFYVFHYDLVSYNDEIWDLLQGFDILPENDGDTLCLVLIPKKKHKIKN